MAISTSVVVRPAASRLAGIGAWPAAPSPLAGAVGVDISAGGVRAVSRFGSSSGHTRACLALPADGVAQVRDAIVAAVQAVEPEPKLVVVATPGLVDRESGSVSAAANLGDSWQPTVPLRALLEARLGCEVQLRNDTEAALQAEQQRGGLVTACDGALITLSTGVGIALLRNGREQPTELGHSVLQLGGPPCRHRAHRGCYESFLGGWALPLRYKEWHPEFTGATVEEIPDDAAFWAECGARLAELVLMVCRLGQRLDAVSLIGPVAVTRAARLLPAVRARIGEERAALPYVPRRLTVTPLGEDVTAIGALIIARGQLFPFAEW
jgi:predicted NBD/HSP70 family sugar kinase